MSYEQCELKDAQVTSVTIAGVGSEVLLKELSSADVNQVRLVGAPQFNEPLTQWKKLEPIWMNGPQESYDVLYAIEANSRLRVEVKKGGRPGKIAGVPQCQDDSCDVTWNGSVFTVLIEPRPAATVLLTEKFPRPRNAKAYVERIALTGTKGTLSCASEPQTQIFAGSELVWESNENRSLSIEPIHAQVGKLTVSLSNNARPRTVQPEQASPAPIVQRQAPPPPRPVGVWIATTIAILVAVALLLWLRRRTPKRPQPAPPETQYDVFLSHCSVDDKEAQRLKQALEALQLRVWIDDEDILAGEEISQAIEKGLRKSRSVVVLLSRHALASRWVQREGSVALFADLPVIPVLLAGVRAEELPPLLRIHKALPIQKKSDWPIVAAQVQRALAAVSR